MNKNTLKLMPIALLASILFSGCGEKSECDIPTRHVHLYTKEISDEIIIQKYMEDETLNNWGYKWHENYIEVNSIDANVYHLLEGKGLFLGEDNWEYLYDKMANTYDYLSFYYEYETVIEHEVTDSDGNKRIEKEKIKHTGWTQDPNYMHNTGETRLYHHRFFGYQIICENGRFRLVKSPLVDDIREAIFTYPYFSENCTQEVFTTHYFSPYELPRLSVEQFTDFKGPDLTNPNLTQDFSRTRKNTEK